MDTYDVGDQSSKGRMYFFVLIVLFFDAMGMGLVLPVLPDLIRDLSNLPLSRAAEIAGWLLFSFAAMQFLFAPTLGALGDRFGRRPIIIVSLFGLSADYFLMSVAPSLYLLFIARVISGVFSATIPTACACIVDITDPEDRARYFGYTGVAIGLGFILGPVIGGFVGQFGPRVPFAIASLLTGIAAIYGLMRFSETLPSSRRRAFNWARSNPISSLMSIRNDPVVLTIVGSVFLVHVANQSFGTTWAFFTREVVGWGPLQTGLSSGAYGLSLVLIQGALTGLIVARIGEVKAVVLSLGIGCVTLVGLSVAASTLGIYFWIFVGGFAGFAFPAMQAIMTARTQDDAQGELQGALAATFSLATIIGPVLMSQVFAEYSDAPGTYFPGAPLALGAAFMILALGTFGLAMRRARRTERPFLNTDGAD